MLVMLQLSVALTAAMFCARFPDVKTIFPVIVPPACTCVPAASIESFPPPTPNAFNNPMWSSEGRRLDAVCLREVKRNTEVAVRTATWVGRRSGHGHDHDHGHEEGIRPSIRGDELQRSIETIT